MGFPTPIFYGQLGKEKNKTTYDYTKQLDYKLSTTDERKELLFNILNPKKHNDDFFVDYYSDEDNGKKHFNPNPNSKDCLATDSNISKALEQMANYLIYAPDAKPLYKNNSYKFVTQEELWNMEYKELSIDDHQDNKPDYNKINDNLIYFVRTDTNYYLENTQQILKKDYLDEEIKSKLEEIDIYIEKARENRINYPKMKKRYNILIKNYRKDMIDYKNGIKQPIVFTKVSKGTTKIDWSMCDYGNHKHIMALLRVKSNKFNDNGVGVLVYDLQQLMKNIKFTKFENELLKVWEDTDYTFKQIADVLKVKPPFITGSFKRIVRKIIEEYDNEWFDWYFLNQVKGTYKTCSKCEETKLISEFDIDRNNKDGYKNVCKICRKKIIDKSS